MVDFERSSPLVFRQTVTMQILLTIPTTLALLSSISGSPLRGNHHLRFETRQLTNPPVPGVAELKTHLNVPDPDTCMFFTGGTYNAAQTYADNNGKKLLASLDKDGWAATTVDDDAPDDDNGDYAADCPISDTVQIPLKAAGLGWGDTELDSYWDNMSQAFTEICSGTVLLGLPPSLEIPSDSVFARIEFPVIKAGGGINRIDSITLGVGYDTSVLSGVSLFWERC